MPARKSILEYLRSDSPIVSNVHYAQDDIQPSKKGRNTTSPGYAKPKCILEWEDFEFDSLQAIYKGRLRKVLDQEINNFIDRSAIPHLPFCEIHDEDSLEALLIKWNQSVVSDALDVTQKLSGADQAQAKIYMVRGGQANRIPKCQPDWAGVLRASTKQRTSSILPGDTKVGWKWSSRDIEVGDVDSVYIAKDWLEPIKQIYTYCSKLKVRYGYIITEKELVVTRIRPFSQDHLRSPVNTQDSALSFPSPKKRATAITSESSKIPKQNASAEAFEEGTLEYKAIPWSSNASDNSLTINLALWWLHMMALESHEICYWYPPLAEDIGSQTKEFDLAVRTSHAGTKRSRDEMSSEDDASYAYLSPKQTPKRSTRSHAKRRQTDWPAYA